MSLNSFIHLALAEDVGDGDHSTDACIGPEVQERAQLLVKDNGIIAGVNMAEKIFFKLDPELKFNRLILDGKEVKEGDIAFTLEGSARTILKGERLVLNCMQRMSGVATYTRYLSDMIAHTKAKLLDTRKTTPNFRMMEKWAVVIGGGKNHRYNLSDMVMLKDNHIDYAGGIAKAVEDVHKYLKEKGLERKIEVEARDLDEVKQVLEVNKSFKVDRVMLDNMSVVDMTTAVGLVDGIMEIEASGGITEETIVPIAETGVDFISVGALTHTYKSLDLSLKAVNG